MDRRECPVCRSSIGESDRSCSTCGLRLEGPLAEDLLRVHGEFLDTEAALRDLNERRRELEARRGRLVEQGGAILARLRAAQDWEYVTTTTASEGHARRPAQARTPVHTPAPVAVAAAPPSAPARPAPIEPGPRRDLSRFAVQNLLLLLGGLLLGIAAIVFTVVSWGHLTIRATVLATITMGTLAVPRLLVRRRLQSTAETVAYMGLVFVPLTGLAVVNAVSGRTNAPEELGVSGAENTGLWAAAGASAMLAALWAGYARVMPLKLPAPTAVAIAQVPLPLAAIAAGPTQTGVALALIATAAFDLVIWLRSDFAPKDSASKPTSVAIVAAVAGLVAGVAGTGTALSASFAVPSLEAGLRVSGVLVLAALLSATGGWFLKDEVHRGLASGASAVSFVAACATPVAEIAPEGWAVAAYAASACLVLAGMKWTPERLRQGSTVAGLGALALTVIVVVPEVLINATVPFTGSVDAWEWNGSGAYGALGLDQPGVGHAAAPLVLGAAAIVAAFLPRLTPWTPGIAARPAALVLAASAVLVLPAAADVPYTAAVAVVLALAVALLAIATWVKNMPLVVVSTGLGVYVAVLAFMWASPEETLWLVVAGVIAVAFLVCSAPARTAVAQAAWVAGAVVGVSAFLLVLWIHLEWREELLPFAWLGVRLAALLVALLVGGISRVLARRPAQAIALDISTAAITLAAALLSLALLGNGQEWSAVLSLTLAITAVLAAASAWSLRRAGRPNTYSLAESYVFGALAPLPLSAAFFPALFGPYGWVVAGAWEGAPESARAALSPETTWTVQPALMPVLLLAAVAAMCAAAVHKGRWAALGVAQVVVPIAVAPLPLAADLPYWAALAFLVALTTGLALWAAMNRTAAGGAALWTATLAVSWSLADRTATLAVLAALALACVVCAFRGGRSPVASVASGVAALAVGAEGAAAALAGDLPARYAAFVVLAVAVLAVRAGALLHKRPEAESRPPWLSHTLYAAALVLWCAALAMTEDHVDQLTLVLAIGGFMAVTVAARLREESARWVVLVFVWGVQGIALLAHVEALGEAVLRPYSWVADTWSGSTGPDITVQMAAAVVAGLVALTAIASGRVLDGARGAYRAAVIAVPIALLVLPITADLPYAAGLSLTCGLVIALAVRATLARTADHAAGAMALWLTTLALAWSSAHRPATLAVTGGLAVLATGCALFAREAVMRCASAAVAVLASGGLVAAASLAAGLRVELAGLAVLAVAVPAALGAWEIGHRRREAGLSVEIAGYAVAGAGTAMCCVSVLYATIALACAGLLALAVAVRADRRQALWAAAVLLHLALWLRLGDSGVTAPEAYTASVTVLGLLGGRWLRQRDHALSSWTAYAPALALTLLPSLAVAWNDDGLTRPLLLGLVAFASTLAGAWTRLQALLLLGGTVLVVNAAHELYPALADLVGDGPRWLPIALTGAALLFTGATYEHRLRDIRRVRASIAKMS